MKAMLFRGRCGSLVRQTMLNTIRCFSSSKLFIGGIKVDKEDRKNNGPLSQLGFQDGAETIKGMGIYDRWLIVMKEHEPNPFRGFIQTLAVVVGGEEEARKLICSVSLGHYNVFGAVLDDTTALQIKALPRVRWVLHDFYVDHENKRYGGVPMEKYGYIAMLVKRGLRSPWFL